VAQVIIGKALVAQINKTFKKHAPDIFAHLETLSHQPKKGKTLGSVGGIVIKELKHEGFRFYFVTDGHKLAYYNDAELQDLLILFVRMSNKKQQQKTIDEIKNVLKQLGTGGFE